MGAEDNAKVARRAYEAFISGDMATLTELFAEDSAWHLAGSGGLSGDRRGRDAVFGYFGELLSGTGGAFQVTLRDVIGGEEYSIGNHHVHAERNGSVLDNDVVIVVRVINGHITEVWEFHQDQASNDQFWS